MRYGWKQSAVLAMVVAATLSTTGCGKKAPPPVPPAPADEGAERARREAEERARREAEERARREAEARAAEEAAREAARKRATLEEMVFFDFDDARVREDARAVLGRKIEILRADPSITLRVTGHADERGSTEYNMVLGMRRATSIRDYLAGYGIAASRVQTLSLGEERPLAQGHDERAWSQNRRGEFTITGGLTPGD